MVEVANDTRVCPTVVLDVATEPHNRFQYRIPEGAVAYRSQKDLNEAHSVLKRQVSERVACVLVHTGGRPYKLCYA